MHVCMYVYTHTCIHMHVYMYIILSTALNNSDILRLWVSVHNYYSRSDVLMMIIVNITTVLDLTKASYSHRFFAFIISFYGSVHTLLVFRLWVFVHNCCSICPPSPHARHTTAADSPHPLYVCKYVSKYKYMYI
jgi:hypothetical protein